MLRTPKSEAFQSKFHPGGIYYEKDVQRKTSLWQKERHPPASFCEA